MKRGTPPPPPSLSALDDKRVRAVSAVLVVVVVSVAFVEWLFVALWSAAGCEDRVPSVTSWTFALAWTGWSVVLFTEFAVKSHAVF